MTAQRGILPLVTRRFTYLILAVAGITAIVAGWLAWHNSRTFSEAEMLKHLPTVDAVVLSIDFDQLRHSGVFDELAGAKVLEEPDYQTFVRDSGFDYKRDLDRALASFGPAGNFFVVEGRFDWRKLRNYALKSGGSCYNDLCHMTGSQPDRRISFVPLATDVMGLAVTTSETAAAQLIHTAAQRLISAPAQPVWISVPGSALGRSSNFVPAAKLLTSAMTGVNDLMLTLGAGRGPQSNNFAARMEAQCRTTQDAANLTGQLTALTALLKNAIERQKKKPNPNDLSGVLSAGAFHQSDRTVYGEWTLQKSFLDNLAGM
jgi:hypothetical protein